MPAATPGSSRLAGSFYMLAAAACWGGMFPVAKALPWHTVWSES